MNQTPDPHSPPRPAPRARLRHLPTLFFRHILSLPHWQKALLVLAALAGGAGLLSHATATKPAAAPTSASPDAIHSAPHSNAFDNAPDASAPPDATAPPAATPDTSSPWFGRIGISIVLGFLIGWLTRTFVKLMAMLAALFAGALGALSYFHIANVDLTAAANAEYKTASAWITEQAARLKNAAIAHIPSTGGGLVGVYLGAKRRR